MNRKLKKLLEDPRQFLLDSRLFAALGLSGLFAAKFLARKVQGGTGRRNNLHPITTVKGYELFNLHGENWINGSSKPVAILWGFIPWKRGFVTDYLHDYRVAFVRGKTPWPRLEAALDRLDDVSFIVWGYTEDEAVRSYARRRGITVARMEDGFIRSASLGSEHSVPYSLVLDRNGLYFNAQSPSDLEGLLNSHDFAAEETLLSAVPSLMRLHRELGISKYNLGSFGSAASLLGAKQKRRILVVGQVEDDASIKYGLASGWTCRQLVELAVSENPGAEVIYRPHPDVVQGYRANSAELDELRRTCRVITDDVRLAELLQLVDQVYVITSLTGMEALIHGVPVTAVGAPFYAGWGLTDDRQVVPRRQRRLSLEQLFCAAYLLYPRYLANLEDPVVGCLATMLRIAAERRKKLDTLVSPELVETGAAIVAGSDYWPSLLKPDIFMKLQEMRDKKIFDVFSVTRALADTQARRYQRSVAYLLAGTFQQPAMVMPLLERLRASLDADVYQNLLVDLWRARPSAEILEQWAGCCQPAGELEEARPVLERLAFGAGQAEDPESRLPISPEQIPDVLRLAQSGLDQKQFERSEQLFNQLLLSGSLQAEVLVGLAEIARLRFDFASAAALLGIACRLHPGWRLGRAHVLHAQASSLCRSPFRALESMAVACLTNPQYVESVGAILDVLEREVGELPYAAAMLCAVEVSDSANVIGRARGLIVHERAAEAERLLLRRAPKPAQTVKYALALSLAYSYQGKLGEAKELVVNLLREAPTLPVYREALRLAVIANDYAWGKALLEAARDRDLEVGDIYHRKIALGLGEIKQSYLSFRRMKAHGVMRGYLGEKYVQELSALAPGPDSTNLFLGVFGPGDEIRFASLYRDMAAKAGQGRAMFTCDPRLLNLLSRHYADLEFVPSARIRSLAWLDSYSHHDQLPGSDLHTFFDNRGWAAARAADKVTLVTDALGDVIDGYASFKGKPYLKADPLLVQKWRRRLAEQDSGELLVGLSWRSTVTAFSRNEHYLAVKDLLPLFELKGMKFVNLQYDDCREELAWLEARFPGRLLHFDDLDQFNDLDGVAALMECLDLVIAPATTVVELAGALGRPAYLLSNSSELHWRKIPGTQTDVWHHSVMHIDAPVLGEKAGLIQAVASTLMKRVEDCRMPKERAA